jgi:hypothetical protein
VDAGSVLGVQSLRASLLDDVSAAEPRETKNDHRVSAVTSRDNQRYVLEDDDDLDEDDDDFGEDEDEDDDEDGEEEDDEDIETWQVSGRAPSR